MLFQPVVLRFFSKATKLEKFFPVKKEIKIPEFYPKQHPKNLEARNNDIILTEKPPVYMTPPHNVPYELYLPKNAPFESPNHSKALDVAIIGSPNTGKSSLMNRFIKTNLSAVSNKSNTTDEAIKGVYTNIEKRTQLVFYDTPGITQRYKGTGHFITKAWDTLIICDKALFVVDSLKRIDDSMKEALNRLKRMNLNESFRKKMRKLKQEENNEITKEMIEELQKEEPQDKFGDQTIPTYLILNKIDLCTNKRRLKWLINDLEDIARFEKIFYTSAETGYGIEDIINTLEEEAYTRPWEYNPNSKSDASEADYLLQTLKGFVYERFYHELPHRIEMQVSEFRVRSDGVFKVQFTLHVDSESQASIVIGHKGKNLQYLKDRIACELATKYQKEVQVNITVKRNSDQKDFIEEEVIAAPGSGKRLAEKEIEMLKSGIALEELRK